MTVMHSVRAAWLCLLVAPLIHAQSAPNQVHTPPQSDPGVYSGRLKVDYPTRYEPATIEEVRAVLERVHAYLEQAAPLAVVNAVSGEPVAVRRSASRSCAGAH